MQENQTLELKIIIRASFTDIELIKHYIEQDLKNTGWDVYSAEILAREC